MSTNPVDEYDPADPCPHHGRDDEVDELERLLLDSQRENELLKGKNWRLEVQVADLITERERGPASSSTKWDRAGVGYGPADE